MKKILLLVAIVATSVMSVNAQENLKWGVVAGMNLSKMSATGLDSKLGYHVGVRAELGLPQVANGLYLDASALLSAKGAKMDFGDLGSQKINANYLEIPIHIGYKYAVNDNFSVFGSFGPYFSYGLFGKTKVEELDYDDEYELMKTSSKYDTFGNDGLKRFDCGLGLNVGVEIKKTYRVAIGYDFGLTETYKSKFDAGEENYEEFDFGSGAKNRNLTISVAYMF